MPYREDEICEICNERKAELKVIQMIGGKRKEIAICRQCSLKAGIAEQLRPENLELETIHDLDHKCPECGWSLLDVVNTGFLGCSECYNEYFDEISSIHTQIGAKKYRQDEKSRSEAKDKSIRISALRWQMQKAIDEEHFEEAARIRDLLSIMQDTTPEID